MLTLSGILNPVRHIEPCVADLQGLQIRPVLKAEGIAELPPGHELIKELAGAIAAVTEAVPRNLEGRDHPIMMVRCTQQS